MTSSRQPRRDTEVTVTVVRGGRPIKHVKRPVRESDEGQPIVTYKGERWLLLPGNQIVLDSGHGARARPASGRSQSGLSGTARTAGTTKTGARSSRNVPSGVPSDDARRVTPPYSEHRLAPKKDQSVESVPDHFDERQRTVIEAHADARLLVDAGPGTGKTAVACRRVAWLIESCDVSPANIWLISFTRTAVREIRARIGHYLSDPENLLSVRIATLDSHAWAIHSGFDAGASLQGAYDDNISRVIELVRASEGVFEYLSGVEHVLVDEAQDIVGLRAELLLELMRRLPARCGITVFADEAQAIYGFADGDLIEGVDNAGVNARQHLASRLRSGNASGFREESLSHIYRVNNEGLRALFSDVRQQVLLSRQRDETDRLGIVTGMVRELADSADSRVEDLEGLSPDELFGTFILFRRRIDVLTAAAFWGARPHRIRMAGLPAVVEPWLGAMFWDWTAKTIGRQEFERRWSKRVEGRSLTARTQPDAWAQLIATAGDTPKVLDMSLLRSRLGRSVPPADFVRSDFGLGGPVFGTVHGCKGREADRVLFMLPTSLGPRSEEDEEARVVFVGATRARSKLLVGDGFKALVAAEHKSVRRTFALKTSRGGARAQVEFGRQGDLTPEGVAGHSLFESPEQVMASHQWLLEHSSTVLEAVATASPDRDWRYGVGPDREARLAYLSANVGRDLFSIAKVVKTRLKWKGKMWPGSELRHLRMFGACTQVLSPDDPEKTLLHEPWATSGFVLAPVIQGFDMNYFRKA